MFTAVTKKMFTSSAQPVRACVCSECGLAEKGTHTGAKCFACGTRLKRVWIWVTDNEETHETVLSRRPPAGAAW